MQISLPHDDFQVNTVIVADYVDENFDAIKGVVNGNIDTDNLVNAAVEEDIIATNAVTTSKIKDGNVTYPKIDFSTLPVAILYFTNNQGFVIQANTITDLIAETLETNNQTVITKQQDGVFKVSEAGFYQFTWNVQCIDVTMVSNTFRIAYSTDNVNWTYNGWLMDFALNDTRMRQGQTTLKMAANSYIKLQCWSTVNTRVGWADDANNKYSTSVCLRRVG